MSGPTTLFRWMLGADSINLTNDRGHPLDLNVAVIFQYKWCFFFHLDAHLRYWCHVNIGLQYEGVGEGMSRPMSSASTGSLRGGEHPIKDSNIERQVWVGRHGASTQEIATFFTLHTTYCDLIFTIGILACITELVSCAEILLVWYTKGDCSAYGDIPVQWWLLFTTGVSDSRPVGHVRPARW